MSIYDNAGVALIPSGTKASKLYSVLPANGDGDFTHSRGSTATRVNKDGFIESVATNVPRLDYPLIDGVVQDCPALLLEPTSTNYTTRSEEFDNSAWTKSGTTVTANQEIAPDGVLTADKILETTASSTHIVYNFVTGTSGNNTFSVFVKPINRKKIRLAQNLTVNSRADFDIDTLSVSNETGGATGKIEKFPNGWFRLSISFSATFTSMLFAIYILDDSGNDSYTGNTSNGFYLWGAMNEYLPYPTSYIKTSGSTVTRSTDVCNGSGTSAEFNDSEGVLFAEISALADDLTNRRLTLSDGTDLNRMALTYNTSSNTFFCFVVSNNSTVANFSFSVSDITQFHKVSLKYKENDFALWVDGFEVATDTSGNPPTGLDELKFEQAANGNNFYGKSKQLMTFKTALTDSELETLTSWDSFNAMAKGQLYTIE